MRADPITQTTRDIAAELPPLAWGYRRSVLREIESGLRDAQDAYVAAGERPDSAARRALDDFGDPGEVARELATEAGARAVRRLAAVQAVLLVGSVLGWAVAGLTSPHDTQVENAGATVMHAVFVAIALPAVLVGLIAHRRLGRPALSDLTVRWWGALTGATVVLSLAATQAASLLKAWLVEEPVQPGDLWLSSVSHAVALGLGVWAALVLVTVQWSMRPTR